MQNQLLGSNLPDQQNKYQQEVDREQVCEFFQEMKYSMLFPNDPISDQELCMNKKL